MSSLAELLRAAAVRVRDVARQATEPPWTVHTPPLHGDDQVADVIHTMERQVAGDHEGFGACRIEDARHIALWHPGVAFADAELWEEIAAWIDSQPELARVHIAAGTCADHLCGIVRKALAVARALLPEEVDHE